jgi:hypothetical protein
MAQPKPSKPADKIEVEPGADKRLAGMLKKVLNTPPTHVSQSAQKPRKSKPKRLPAR